MFNAHVETTKGHCSSWANMVRKHEFQGWVGMIEMMRIRLPLRWLDVTMKLPTQPTWGTPIQLCRCQVLIAKKQTYHVLKYLRVSKKIGLVPPNIPKPFFFLDTIQWHFFRMFLHWVPGSGAWLDQTLGGQSACGLLWRVRGLTVFFLALGVEFFSASGFHLPGLVMSTDSYWKWLLK